MKAIILAAGRGSRLKSFTENKPKCLSIINGKTLIEHQIISLSEAGCKEIALVTGYKSEKLQFTNKKMFFNEEWQTTNMVFSLACADCWLKNNSFIVSYSDIFYNKSAPLSLLKSEADITITYDKNWRLLWEKRFENPLDDAETFSINNDSELIDIGRKTKDINEINGQYMGLIKFSAKGWTSFKNTWKSSFKNYKSLSMTAVFQALIQKKNEKIYCIPYEGIWGEVDTVKDLKLYETS